MSSYKKGLKEKCGVIGIFTEDENAAHYARTGLASLQHRGLESAGVSIINKKGDIKTYKGMGLIPHVLTDTILDNLGQSNFAIAQNRYGTFGESSIDNAQPLEEKLDKFQLSFGHNGNLPDVSNLVKAVSKHPKASADTALMARLLIEKRPSFSSWEETLLDVLPKFHGAYCLTLLTNNKELFAIRDPFGIRPLCIGKLHGGWIIASESVALDAVNADFVRDVAPGEIIKINSKGDLKSTFFGEVKKPQPCIFEHIYFSRPDSFINGKRVKAGREKSGSFLGERIRNKGIKADIVIPIFDSGYPAAKGVAKELDIPIVDAITTSHYVGRTFIRPGQQNRVAAVSGKHNVVPDEIRGKRVIVVDDSAVRLTTSTILAKDIRKAGADKIYMAFASPPVINQCDMGIDMRTKQELPAAEFEKKSIDIIEKKMAKHIKADEVIYLPIEETALAMGGTKDDFYHYIFGGPHPIRGKQHTFPKMKKKIGKKIKICVFISGRGTFLQDIIEGTNTNDIDAEISCVISNKEGAYGLTRANKYNIPTKTISFDGKLSDKEARKKYDEKLISEVKKVMPDLIMLSGWQLILGETFLKEAEQLEIPVVNHHPALLSKKASETVRTSKGKIPVLRGGSVWREVFEKNLPVSGITFHQVLPGDMFDVGPIIMKAEVVVKPEDTFDSWKVRMDETEHQLMSTVTKRLVHVLKQNIDITKGDFPW